MKVTMRPTTVMHDSMTREQFMAARGITLPQSDEAPAPPATPHDHKDKWDEADVTALKLYVMDGKGNRYIAERMGRTIRAVASKRYRLRKAGR